MSSRSVLIVDKLFIVAAYLNCGCLSGDFYPFKHYKLNKDRIYSPIDNLHSLCLNGNLRLSYSNMENGN